MVQDKEIMPRDPHDKKGVDELAEANVRNEDRIALTTLAKALLSFAPGGGAIVEVINGAQAVKQSRQDKYLRMIIQDHGHLIEELHARLGVDEDLLDIVIRGLDAAQTASFEEKVRLLAAVAAGCIEEDSPNRVLARVLFQVIEVVEREHIEVLKVIRDWTPVPEGLPQEEAMKLIPNTTNIAHKLPHMRPIVGVIVNSLASLRVIKDAAAGTWFGNAGNSRYAVDELGRHLLEYLDKQE